jgi:hypothetical protein
MGIKYDVVVVGGGAAGLIAAGRAASSGARVLLVEKNKTAGRKILVTGKGRCNISNDAHQSTYFKNIFPNGKYLKHAFGAFFSDDIVQLLTEQGLETTTERGGRIFPTSNSAVDVLNALMFWVKKQQVEIIYSAKVESLLTEGNVVKGVEIIRNGQNQTFFASSIIICTGGKSYPATGSTGDGYQLAGQVGHTVIAPRPALVPLVTSGKMASELQGLSLKNVNASVWSNNKKQREEFGEMLFAHYGLTGPIILTLSRFVVDELLKKNPVTITIDLKPALDENKLDARLIRDLATNGKKQIENIFKEWLPAKLIPVFLEHLKIDGKKAGHQMNSAERRKVMLLMKNLPFEVIDYRGFKEAIITAGGISTDEIDGKTMQSKIVQNLYFAGEVIDLDANTGGFNLQIAYSTGWLAASSCTNNHTPLTSANYD